MRARGLAAVLWMNFRLCAQDVLANRSRFRLSAISIFLGAFTLLVDLAILRGMETEMSQSLGKMGGASIVTIKQIAAFNAVQQVDFLKSKGLNYPEVEGLARDLDFIKAVLPEKVMGWQTLAQKGGSAGFFVRAVGAAHLENFEYTLLAGGAFTLADMQSVNRVCLLGFAGADKLFGSWQNALGGIVFLNSRPFKVIGILNGDGPFDLRSWEMVFPHSAYLHEFGSLLEPEPEIRILLVPGRDPDSVKAILRESLLALHRQVEDFTIVTNLEAIEEVRRSDLAIKVLLWCVAGLSLATGGVCIMNIMFAGISDRMREIGTRKALGARPLDIHLQFNLEAVGMSLIGGGPGMLAGAVMPFLLKGLLPFQFSLEPSDFLLAAAFVSATGFASGFIPAFKAARLSPMEALAG